MLALASPPERAWAATQHLFLAASSAFLAQTPISDCQPSSSKRLQMHEGTTTRRRRFRLGFGKHGGEDGKSTSERDTQRLVGNASCSDIGMACGLGDMALGL